MVFIPVVASIGILIKWSVQPKTAIYAIIRMVLQLILIGYFLVSIFNANQSWIVLLVLSVMIVASSWIALRTVKTNRRRLLKASFLSVFWGGGLTLAVVTFGVLRLDPWYSPRFVIPLAGMIFANSMTSISLAAERFFAETERSVPFEKARNMAFQTALIPIINALFAVGLVSLPGMMTGQILSGVSPLIAARYQIMVMCMIFGSTGLSTAIFLKSIGDSSHA